MVRFLTFTTVGFPIAFCVAPNDLGPAFARLGVPDKFAFGVDLTFRFIPSLADDLQTTIDAQRVRGYDPDKLGRGPVGRLRRLGPVVVPLTINAIVNAEDTIDAMDLRAFGTGPSGPGSASSSTTTSTSSSCSRRCRSSRSSRR